MRLRIQKFLIIAPTENEWWYALGAYWNMEISSAHNIDRDPCSFRMFDRVRSWQEAIEYVNEHGITAFVASCVVRLRREWIPINIRRTTSRLGAQVVLVGNAYQSSNAMILNRDGAQLLMDKDVTPPDFTKLEADDRVILMPTPFVENHEFTEPKLC